MDKIEFHLRATPALESIYRDLLREDYTEATLSTAIDLVRRILDTSHYRISFEWERRAPIRAPRKAAYAIPPAANDYLQEFLERANASLPHDMPEEVSDKTVLERRAQEAAVLVTFQSRVTITGASGFLRDAQSVLFQHSLHVLSPRLAARQLDDANSFLLHALYAHTQLAWADTPTHQQYLLASLFEHTGDAAAAMRLLDASLNSSSVDDHDFLTKAQSYWSLLVQSDRLAEAKSFLLSLYRRAGTKDLHEIQELLDETYALQDSAMAS